MKKLKRKSQKTNSRIRRKASPGGARADFLDSMAHEIRVLINAILGFSNLLNNTSLEDKQKEYVRTIVTSGQLLRKVVNDILDFSKAKRGKLVLEQIDFELPLLIEEVTNILKIKIGNKPIKMDYRVHERVPSHLTGDPTRLKQIILNLLDNAIKFTEQGEIILSVDLKSSPEKEAKLMFSVHDTGIGIPPEKKKDIFQSFMQADSSTARKYGGSGLGLAIAKSYVDAMKGKIWFESEVGKGTTFFFTLSFSVQSSVSFAKRASRTALALEGSCRGIKVLVAEDNMQNQDLLRAYFEVLGCDGDFASSGQEAIEKIQKSKYDVCFMDLQLQGLGGIEATRIIREKVTKDLPVIAVTASSKGENRKEYKRVGITDHLGKPYDMSQLRDKILLHAHGKKE